MRRPILASVLLLTIPLTAAAQPSTQPASPHPNFSPESMKIIDHFLSAGGSCVADMAGPEVDTMTKDDNGHIVFTHTAIFAGGREYERTPVGYLTDATWSQEARVIARGAPLFAQMVGNGGSTWTWRLIVEDGTVKVGAGNYSGPFTKCGTRPAMIAYAKTLS